MIAESKCKIMNVIYHIAKTFAPDDVDMIMACMHKVDGNSKYNFIQLCIEGVKKYYPLFNDSKRKGKLSHVYCSEKFVYIILTEEYCKQLFDKPLHPYVKKKLIISNIRRLIPGRIENNGNTILIPDHLYNEKSEMLLKRYGFKYKGIQQDSIKYDYYEYYIDDKDIDSAFLLINIEGNIKDD